MANLIIDSFRVVDEEKNPIPQHESMPVFIARFTPSTTEKRFSDKLYVEAYCRVLNATSQPIQGYFRLVLNSKEEYDFHDFGEAGEIKYYKQVSDMDRVYLPFQLTNLIALNHITNANFTLTARDTATGSTPGSPRRFQIKPI